MPLAQAYCRTTARSVPTQGLRDLIGALPGWCTATLASGIPVLAPILSTGDAVGPHAGAPAAGIDGGAGVPTVVTDFSAPGHSA